MPYTLMMPKLSPTMQEGILVKWHKQMGEFVNAGDALFDVATDKATVEYQSLDEGWLRKILVQAGGEAYVNQAVAIFTSEKEESIEGYQPEGIASLVKNEANEAGVMPFVEKMDRSENVAPIAIKGVGQESGAVLLPQFLPEPPLENYVFEYPVEKIEGRILASPLARKIAEERGIDLASVKGSGPNERIVLRDLEKGQSIGKVQFGRRRVPVLSPGSYQEVSLTPLRKVLCKRLQESKSSIPHFYVTMPVDMEPIVHIREQLKIQDIKLTINDFIIRACALTLREFPFINAGFNATTSSIIQFKTIDIAVAVSLESGLITPIIRHADFKNLGEIAIEMRSLAQRARKGSLDPTEYKGGSFSVTNLGMYGVSEFQAIVNPPQAAILAVSAIRDLPVVRNGVVVAGKELKLTLSVDHRVVDGVDAALFLKELKKALENPSFLLIG